MKNQHTIKYECLKKSNQEFEFEIKNAVNRVLNSGWYILGQEVAEFERSFASYVGSKFCIGVANGLDALILSIEALRLPKNSEILVASNTYIATILAIIRAGHQPVLVEPVLETFNIDPEKIKAVLTSRTKAICVTHLFGGACDLGEIVKICETYGLKLVEDCAQSHGTTYKGKHTGTFGSAGCFSFYPTKNLGCLGDGGAIVTDDPNMVDYLQHVRNYGSKTKYCNRYIGHNSRLDELQAAVLLAKLKHFDRVIEHKRKLAEIYNNNLPDFVAKPVVDPFIKHTYHIYGIRFQRRDNLRDWLTKNNVGTEVHYPISPHRQEALRGMFQREYPISDELHNTELSLPISYGTTLDDVNMVVKIVKGYSVD